MAMPRRPGENLNSLERKSKFLLAENFYINKSSEKNSPFSPHLLLRGGTNLGVQFTWASKSES